MAGSANCALGSRANSASLAVSVCQCHLGRAALQYLSSAQRAHTHTHTHGCTQESTGRDVLHIHAACTQMQGRTTAHTHTHTGRHTHRHSRPLTARHLCTASDFSLCFVLCPCFCSHKLSVPLLPSFLSSSLILPATLPPQIPVLCHDHLCIDTLHVFFFSIVANKIKMRRCLTGLFQDYLELSETDRVHRGSCKPPFTPFALSLPNRRADETRDH